MFYCSLIYNFFQWKMMRTSSIISLATSFPPCLFLFVCTFLCICDIKIKSNLERLFLKDGWLDDNKKRVRYTRRGKRTWKPATCNLPTCCVVSIQFYRLPLLLFCSVLSITTKLWIFPFFFFHHHYLFTFRWSKLNLYVKNTNLFQWLDEISLMLGLVYII